MRKRWTVAAAAAVTALIASTTATALNAATPTTRIATKQPFPASSIWNLPLGANAAYESARISPSANSSLDTDENILILHPEAPSSPVYESTAGWDNTQTRCGSATSNVLFSAPIPQTFHTDPGYNGSTPNMASAVLLADGRTVKQSQPLHRCADGRTVSQYVYPDSDIKTGDGIEGAHGGSGLSSIGGTIRVGELTPGNSIRHALKLELYAHRYVAFNNDGTPGYRWPATKADGYAAGNYAGPVPSLEMGALLALRPEFNIANLRTEPARIMARALQDYGGYVVDDTGWDVQAVATENGPDGRVTDQFNTQWGFAMSSPTLATCTTTSADCLWAKDIGDMFTNLNVVTNNTPATIGGPGTRRTTCAPPFADGTGGVCTQTTPAPTTTQPPPNPTGRTIKVMPLGDSLTEGGGISGNQSYRGHLYKDLTNAGYNVDFVGSQSSPTATPGDPDHEGHGGFTIGPDQNRYCSSYPTCNPYLFNISDHVTEWLTANPPDVITLLIGINDMFEGTLTAGQSGLDKPGVTSAAAAGKLSALVTKIRGVVPNAKIVVGSLLPVGWTTDLGADYNAVNTMAATLGNTSSTDNVFFADLHAAPLQPADWLDLLHLTDTGAIKASAAWMKVLPGVLNSITNPATPTTTRVVATTPTTTRVVATTTPVASTTRVTTTLKPTTTTTTTTTAPNTATVRVVTQQRFGDRWVTINVGNPFNITTPTTTTTTPTTQARPLLRRFATNPAQPPPPAHNRSPYGPYPRGDQPALR